MRPQSINRATGLEHIPAEPRPPSRSSLQNPGCHLNTRVETKLGGDVEDMVLDRST